MLTRETLSFIEPDLKYSIKEYLPYNQKILLYDVLIFLSLVSETKMFCSSADIATFKEIVEYCKELDIDIYKYFSIAYSYISKYVKKGHRIRFSYFLNENVIEYIGSHIDGSTTSALTIGEVRDDLLITEKSIRSLLSENVTYEQSFTTHLSNNKISDIFLAYKLYCGSKLVENMPNLDYLNSLVVVLEPFFTYILHKNNIYTFYKIKEWNNSKIEDYNFCPLYFRDRYITNELPEAILGNDATKQGTKLHKIFETIFIKYKNSKKKDLADIAEKFFKTKQYQTLIEDLDDHEPFIKQIFSDKTSILHKLVNENTEILTEHLMNVTFTESFYGTADLILVNGTKATLLDYKSSKLDPRFLDKNNAKYNKQLSLYSKLFMALHPEITSMDMYIIYTRGKIHKFETINEDIITERTEEINKIKSNFKHGIVKGNGASCFLCRHPNCAWRVKPSIWNEDGSKKPKKYNS